MRLPHPCRQRAMSSTIHSSWRPDGEALRLQLSGDRQAAERTGTGVSSVGRGLAEIWFNPALNRYTTIPNHPGDMPEGTLRAILKQAGIDVETFLQKK